MVGNFEAKIVDYTIGESKNNRPQVVITFEFLYEDEDGTKRLKRLNWYGSLYAGAVPITLKTLIHCGLNESNFDKLEKLVLGVESELLDTERPRNIDVQEAAHWQDVGKIETKIMWVNDPTLRPTTKKIDEATNNQFFGERRGEFTAELIKLSREMDIPAKDKTQKNESPLPDTPADSNDIPF